MLPTICIFHLNEQCILINKVIVVRYDVGMIEQWKNFYFSLSITPCFIRQACQVNLFPDHKTVVLQIIIIIIMPECFSYTVLK